MSSDPEAAMREAVNVREAPEASATRDAAGAPAAAGRAEERDAGSPFAAPKPWLWLAPMAGVTDPVFRSICVGHGADLAFTEMVSAKGLSYDNVKTHDLALPGEGEARIAVQLFGHEPDVIAREAARLEDELGESLALIDINMGCPVKKVVSKGEGAALMTEPGTASAIVAATAAAVRAPVTAKIRRGWEIGGETAPDLAKRLEAAGAAAVTVHGRFAKQFYRGQADWECIARVKEAVSIPVIGNGDVVSPADAAAMAERTGCDGIMIARGALGRPWAFRAIRAFLADGTLLPEPAYAERVAIAREHCIRAAAEGGAGLIRMRTLAAHYLTGAPGAGKARRALCECSTLEEFLAVLDAFPLTEG